MFCTECGKPVADGNKFCANCGAPVQKILQPQVKPSEPVQPPPSALESQDESSDVAQNVFKYVGAGMLAAAVICILTNVGGFLSGFTLIKALFSSMNQGEYLETSFIFACVILLISHLGVIIFGIVGLVKTLLDGRPVVSCITTLIFGCLGIVSGIIGWNILAELLATVFAIVALILISKIKEDDELPVSIYFTNNPDQKDPFA